MYDLVHEILFLQKTSAFHRLTDDVHEEIKRARHLELISVFRDEAQKLNKEMVGRKQLVLLEGVRFSYNLPSMHYV